MNFFGPLMLECGFNVSSRILKKFLVQLSSFNIKSAENVCRYIRDYMAGNPKPTDGFMQRNDKEILQGSKRAHVFEQYRLSRENKGFHSSETFDETSGQFGQHSQRHGPK